MLIYFIIKLRSTNRNYHKILFYYKRESAQVVFSRIRISRRNLWNGRREPGTCELLMLSDLIFTRKCLYFCIDNGQEVNNTSLRTFSVILLSIWLQMYFHFERRYLSRRIILVIQQIVGSVAFRRYIIQNLTRTLVFVQSNKYYSAITFRLSLEQTLTFFVYSAAKSEIAMIFFLHRRTQYQPAKRLLYIFCCIREKVS